MPAAKSPQGLRGRKTHFPLRIGANEICARIFPADFARGKARQPGHTPARGRLSLKAGGGILREGGRKPSLAELLRSRGAPASHSGELWPCSRNLWQDTANVLGSACRFQNQPKGARAEPWRGAEETLPSAAFENSGISPGEVCRHFLQK